MAKRRFGDRRDARLVRDIPALQRIMCILFPRRTECEVFVKDKLDLTEYEKYIGVRNASHPEYKTTVFHALITAVGRMCKERPKMNRFVQGWNTYERDEISIAFIVKRRFADTAEESLMFLFVKDTDTLGSISYRIASSVREIRKSEHATGGIDEILEIFAKIPRLLLAFVVRIIRCLDFWGVDPKVLTDGDTNYSTVLLANLGSISCPAIYHHLNNYGTTSIMVTLGTIHKEPLLMPDGTLQVRDVVDFGATVDERIADGFYFARSLKLVKHMFAHPELFDLPIGEPSGYEYK